MGKLTRKLGRASKGGALKIASRDAESGRLIEKANKHMERAWEKIYNRSEEAGASKN